jgi:PTS system nitrogen regulatory IIA component
VHFIFLLLAPSTSTGLHLKALARIARLFKNSSLRDHILKAENASAIYSLILEEDSKIT